MDKRRLKVLAIVGVVGVVGGFCSWKAHAGSKALNENVLIYGGGLRLHGSLGAVRNSQSQTEYIGCKVTASSSGSSVLCLATDAAGTQFSCNSSSAYMVDAALGISGDSWLSVNRDSTGTCTLISVENSSVHEPKAP